jgi:hypothetical protein
MRLIFGVGCLAVALFVWTGPAAAADEEEQIRAKLESIQKQLDDLNKQSADLLQQEQDLQVRLTKVRAKQVGAIKAEATGMLRFENGVGPYVSVRYADDPERESRVYLRYTEDKISAKKVEALLGKRVVARGALRQLSEDVRTGLPPLAMYMDAPELEAAESK